MALNNFNTNIIYKQDWQAKKAKKVHSNSKKKQTKMTILNVVKYK